MTPELEMAIAKRQMADPPAAPLRGAAGLRRYGEAHGSHGPLRGAAGGSVKTEEWADV